MENTKIKKAINFDLDTISLQQHYPNKSYQQAYYDIKNFMQNNEFEHRQGSGYISIKEVDQTDILSLTKKLKNEFSWIKNCVNKFDVTDISMQYDLSNIIKEDKLDLDKTLEKKMETKNIDKKNDISTAGFEIKIKSIKNLSERNQSFFKENDGKIYTNDDAVALLQKLTLKDDLTKQEYLNNSHFSKEKIELDIKTKSGMVFGLNLPFGEGNFSKGLNHMINLSANLDRNQPTAEDIKEIDSFLQKDQNGKFIKPAPSLSLDKVFEGGLKGLETISQSTGDPVIQNFISSFEKAFDIAISKTTIRNNPLEKEMSKLNKDINSAIKDGKITPSKKEKDKDRLHPKDKGFNR